MDKKYDSQSMELQLQQKWAREKTYQTKPNQPIYNIDTPPPTVSGSLHIGHIFSYTQTDVLARFQRLMGHNVFYPFGFDDNGLATERFVEKKLKIKGHQLPRSEFIAKCLAESHAAADQFKQLWKSMGLSANLDQTYSTISNQTRKISQSSFIELYEKGFVYRKNEPALYCSNCRTSVAQAELDDQEQPGTFNDLIFKTTIDTEVVISTTRPELLSSCVALLFNPKDLRYQYLKNQMAIVPIFQNVVPILSDETVDPEKGTGLVMCCTFGDKHDIEWFKKFNLPYRQSIGFNGKWLDHTGLLAGLGFKEARTTILEQLKIDGCLKAQRPITHNVNVHERCKNEIEYLSLPQWYIRVLDYKKELIDQVNQINWHPAFMKTRCINWIENLSWDWGISRQRFYGIPFPVWHCQDCQQVIIANPEQLPIDPQETAHQAPCPNCNSSKIIPETDIMDTWNTSSITPQVCFNLWSNGQDPFAESTDIEKFLPMSMRAQAHDIIRTWAFYTITKSWMHHGLIPWREIVISGHVLSSEKEKISKSKENCKVSPEILLTQFPADAIRYWASASNLGYDTAFSEGQIKVGCKLITKLWNAFIFIKGHLDTHQVPINQPTELGLVNEWILTSASECFEQYQSYLNKHEFGHALTTVEKFFWNDFCDNYLELIKNQLFNPDNYQGSEVSATIWTLQHVGLRILQLYSPYLPHITDAIYTEIYQVKVGINSIHITNYDKIQNKYNFTESASLMNHIITVITNIRRLKSENQLSLKTELEVLTIHCNADLAQTLSQHEQLIKGISHAKSITYSHATGISILKLENEQYFAAITL